jgi:hypothetical protein
MGNWRNPGRAERVVVYEEGGEPRQYWRAEDADGNALWLKDEARAGEKASGEAMSTQDLLKAVEASVLERRTAARGRKFRL